MAGSRGAGVAVELLLAAGIATSAPIDTPKEALGFNAGDDYSVATYTQLEAYWKRVP